MAGLSKEGDKELAACVYCTKLVLKDRQDLYNTSVNATVFSKLLHCVGIDEDVSVGPFRVCFGGFFGMVSSTYTSIKMFVWSSV